MWNCLGILLAMIRLSEPYVWNHFKQDIKYLFNRESSTSKQKFSSEPLCAFANSAMNIEFVYLILLGINNFMDSRETRKNSYQRNDIQQKASKLKIENHGKSTRITFCDIKVKDIDKWNVDQESKMDEVISLESFSGEEIFEELK